jgi:hypothetical protein
MKLPGEDGDNVHHKEETLVTDLLGVGRAFKHAMFFLLILVWVDCWGCESLDKLAAVAQQTAEQHVD